MYSGGIDILFQEFLPLFALVFGTSLESAVPGGGGGRRLPYMGYKGDPPKWVSRENILYTVQITFIFIGQTHLVFGKRVCTCVMKHSNAFRTFLNWLKNSKRVWHERKLHIMRVPLFANFDR